MSVAFFVFTWEFKATRKSLKEFILNTLAAFFIKKRGRYYEHSFKRIWLNGI